MKVDQKATPEERVAARAKIAKYYGFDPQQDVKEIDQNSWSHLPVPPANTINLSVPLKEIQNYRVFIVVVRLLEHALNRSYSLELFYNHDGKPQIIGKVTVFARPDHSPCKACAKRRARGSVIRGIIPIPSSIIDEILRESGTSRDQATLDTTAADVTQNLSGELLDTSGKVFATAQGGDGAPTIPDHETASSRVVPVEVTLYTSAVAERTDGTDKPVHLYDWTPHNDVFPVSFIYWPWCGRCSVLIWM